jgi:hypothetical protein
MRKPRLAAKKSARRVRTDIGSDSLRHLAAADSGRAGAEAMTASADKVAGLEGALHDNLEKSNKKGRRVGDRITGAGR